MSRSKSIDGVLQLALGAIEVDNYSACNAHNVRRRSTKHVVPCSGSHPHFVVLQKVRVNEHAPSSAVIIGGHTAIGLSIQKALQIDLQLLGDFLATVRNRLRSASVQLP